MESDSRSSGGVPVNIRRVVTGHTADGAAMFALDSVPPRTAPFNNVPGMVSRLVWAAGPVPGLPFDGSDPTPAVSSIVPAPGESRFLIVTFPPDSVFGAPGFNPEAAVKENLAISPGLAELFEADGMHTTSTVDYAIVLDGEVWLELDDGRTVIAPLGWYPRLLHGNAAERKNWRFVGGGEGIHWIDLDEDVSVDGLLAGRPSGESQASFEKWLAGRSRRTS